MRPVRFRPWFLVRFAGAADPKDPVSGQSITRTISLNSSGRRRCLEHTNDAMERGAREARKEINELAYSSGSSTTFEERALRWIGVRICTALWSKPIRQSSEATCISPPANAVWCNHRRSFVSEGFSSQRGVPTTTPFTPPSQQQGVLAPAASAQFFFLVGQSNLQPVLLARPLFSLKREGGLLQARPRSAPLAELRATNPLGARRRETAGSLGQRCLKVELLCLCEAVWVFPLRPSINCRRAGPGQRQCTQAIPPSRSPKKTGCGSSPSPLRSAVQTGVKEVCFPSPSSNQLLLSGDKMEQFRAGPLNWARRGLASCHAEVRSLSLTTVNSARVLCSLASNPQFDQFAGRSKVPLTGPIYPAKQGRPSRSQGI